MGVKARTPSTLHVAKMVNRRKIISHDSSLLVEGLQPINVSLRVFATKQSCEPSLHLAGGHPSSQASMPSRRSMLRMA